MNIKFPVSWLREYLKTDLATKTIANYLSLSGPSVERIEKRDNDNIFDIEVTTNRPDAFSVFGVAREAFAILASEQVKCSLTVPKGLDLNLQPDTKNILPLDVSLKNPSLCPRFTAIVIDNVKIAPSPATIRNRLEASGIRSLNNIVDISNYIMLELGQPMHTFDYDKIAGSKMILREAKDGEKLTTLDGIKRTIPPGSIVIQDEKRLIDLCGIMGGENSQITKRTKRVILFVQSYDPLRIRKTTQSMAFRTEAAARFEKEVDTENIPKALSRAAYLAKQFTSAKIASEIIDIYPNPPEKKEVSLTLEKLKSYIGIEIPSEKAAKILELLGFKVKLLQKTLIAAAPSWRQNEIERDVDLIEEIARIYGYHRLPSTLPQGQIPDDSTDILEKVTSLKNGVKNLALTEVITYSIISKKLFSQTAEPQNAVEIANPLTEEWQFMRPTILTSLAQVISQNQFLKKDIKIFEIAKTYRKQKGDLPKQDLTLAIALQNSNFYKIKGIVENVFELLERQVSFKKLPLSGVLNVSQSAAVECGSQNVGSMGILKSEIADNLNLEGDLFVCEINLTKIFEAPKIAKTYKQIPKYPPIVEDLSVIAGTMVEIGEIEKETKKAGGELLRSIRVIDVYQDPKLGENKKSVTLRLTFQKQTSTPSQEEVSQNRTQIIAHLVKTFRAKIRR